MSKRVLTQRSFYPREGIVQVDVVVRVPLDPAAYQGYTRDQIVALLEGIGKVIAAANLGATEGET